MNHCNCGVEIPVAQTTCEKCWDHKEIFEIHSPPEWEDKHEMLLWETSRPG